MDSNQRVFYTRIGWPVLAFLAGIVLALTISWYFEFVVVSRIMVVVGIMVLLAFGLMVQTAYYIESGSFVVVDSPLFSKVVVDVKSIEAVEHITNYSLAPALSQHRLMLHGSNRQIILISPEQESDFLALLTSLNPHIQLIYN